MENSVQALKTSVKTLVFSTVQLVTCSLEGDSAGAGKLSLQAATDTKTLLLSTKEIRSGATNADDKQFWTGVQKLTHSAKTQIVTLIEDCRNYCDSPDPNLKASMIKKKDELGEILKQLLTTINFDPPAQRVLTILTSLKTISRDDADAKEKLKQLSTDLMTWGKAFEDSDRFKELIRSALAPLIEYFKTNSASDRAKADQQLDEIQKAVERKHRTQLDAHLAELDKGAPSPSKIPPPLLKLDRGASTDSLVRTPSAERKSVDDSAVLSKTPTDRVKKLPSRRLSMGATGSPRPKFASGDFNVKPPSSDRSSRTQELDVCVIGLTGAGKTSLVERITKGKFEEKVSAEKFSKGGAIGKKNAKISLNMMKMAAESSTSEMVHSFGKMKSKLTFYNAAMEDTRQSLELLSKYSVCLLVLSMDSKRSFQWVENFYTHFLALEARPVCTFVVVATHVDVEKQELSHLEVHELAHKRGCGYVIISSKTGEGIAALLDLVSISKPPKEPQWPITYNPKAIQDDFIQLPDAGQLHQLVATSCYKQGYNIEFRRSSVTSKLDGQEKLEIQHFYDDLPHYANDFKDRPHDIYIGIDEKAGPIAVSQIPCPTGLKTIVRTRKGDFRLMLANTSSTRRIAVIRELFPEFEDTKIRQAKAEELKEKLLNYESRFLKNYYKFGVLNIKKNQTDENVIFGNNDMSLDFIEFLGVLGQRIKIRDWKFYAGELDTGPTQATGPESVYTVFRQFEIMFHVAPLLPFQKDDLQRVERKRHLGNDVVVIVFLESDHTEPFDPQIISSHVNHVYIVVQKVPNSKPTQYRIAVISKPGVAPAMPLLPEKPVFENDAYFRAFLLTKLINCQKKAINSAEFKGSQMHTRRNLLQPVLEQFTK